MWISKISCEFVDNPLAIDTPNPRLGWVFDSTPEEFGKRQTAYRILVASSEETLGRDIGNLWDSGKVVSGASNHLEYGGAPLKARQKVYWKVKAWDEGDAASEWSSVGSWTMGLLSEDDWNVHSTWIGALAEVSNAERFPISVELEEVSPTFRAAARRFHPKGEGPENDYATGVHIRHDFTLTLPGFTISRAILRVAGLGYHEAYLNGKKLGKNVLDPVTTDYTRRVYYLTYEVTDHLQQPENCVGILLGNGWYFPGTPDLFGFEKADWVAPPKCRVELEIVYEDGKVQFVGSRADPTWECSTEGPIRFNCVRSGEVYDARKELPRWAEYGGTQTNLEIWKPVVEVPRPLGTLQAQLCPSMEIVREIAPTDRREPSPGVYVYHFPENVAGWPQITVTGNRGQTIALKINEKLTADGLVDMQMHSGHTYGRFQTCEYTCRGGGPETWHPRFSYQGFQFVQVEGATADQIQSIVAQFVHTAVPRTGTFQCSNALVNQIDEISRNTFLNGLHGYPEDCPQREKAGWTEDALISAQGSVYNFNCLSFYEKWVRDLVDSQVEDGQVPDIVPTPGWGKPSPDPSVPKHGIMADPWWGGTIVALPWTIFRQYGDIGLLREVYPAMVKYVRFLEGSAGVDKMIHWESLLGDWLEVGAGSTANRTPRELTATQGFYFYATILAKTAQLLGDEATAKWCDQLAAEIGRSLNSAFLDPETGLYAEDSQSAQAISLYAGIPPAALREKVFTQLLRNVRETREGHLSTGIVGSYFLYQALARGGAPEEAYKVITAPGYPGFEYMINHESPFHGPTTTLWEDWQGRSSLCHPVQGCVVSFFYEWLAGIQPVEDAPGFHHFVVHPSVVGDLTHVSANLDTLYGSIQSKWELGERETTFTIQVPVNTTAEVILPCARAEVISINGTPAREVEYLKEIRKDHDNILLQVGSGQYSFSIPVTEVVRG